MAMMGIGMWLAGGCASTPAYRPMPQIMVEDKPTELQPGYQALNQEGQRNYVLNQVELGIDALQLGKHELAREALDAALNEIEVVWGSARGARDARRVWFSEGRKIFKGEAYERAMAYYYRGLLYIMANDLENARACFRSGIFQDAFAEEEQHRSDLASFYYLEAWCSLMLNDNVAASEPLRWLAQIRPDAPPPTAADNLLIIGESGSAPVKLAAGQGGAALTYRRGAGRRDVSVTAKVNNRVVTLYPAEDLFWQASTRGGRPIDYILQDKVVFKERWEAAGSSLTNLGLAGILIGSQLGGSGNRDKTMGVGAGLAAIGIIAGAVADKVQPQADTRRIRNFPDTLHVIAMPAEPGSHHVRVEFKSDAGATYDTVEKEVTVPAPRSPNVVWTRPATTIVSGRYYNQDY